MFGSDKYKKAKPKKFANDNERKRYFAIKAYYGKKENFVSKGTSHKKNKKT